MTPRELGRGKLRRKALRDGGHFWELDSADANGRRRRKRLGANKALAERRWAQVIRERDLELAGLGGLNGREVLWRDAFEVYLEDRAGDWKPSYRARVEKDIPRIMRATASRKLGDITLASVLAWRRDRLREVLPQTVNAEVGRLRTFLEWCGREYQLRPNPLVDLERKKAKVEREPRALSEPEVAKLLAACDRLDGEAAMYHQACRTIAGGSKGRKWVAKDLSLIHISEPTRPY